jgi:AcrR family transcriptional regulator
MAAVAKRAQTGKAAVYRRWRSKPELVLDTLLRSLSDPREAALAGSLRDNLIAALATMGETLAGHDALPGFDILGEFVRHPDLRKVFIDRLIEPRLRRIQQMLHDAADRGDIDPHAITPLIARTGPALVLQSFLLTGKPPTRPELNQVVDTILMPLLAKRR